MVKIGLKPYGVNTPNCLGNFGNFAFLSLSIRMRDVPWNLTGFLLFSTFLLDFTSMHGVKFIVPQGLLFGEGRPYLWAGFFRFVRPHFRRLSCITRRPPYAKIWHRLACSYFSFSKLDLRVLQYCIERNDRAIRDFSRFSEKNNCMLLGPNCRN